ncbi:hypothetical protein [Pedobacter nototheniae]|uniref:hypothetical protein n=1 Tax=Pedobacter nototheniae TaxID=2488994 RepID=UPI00103FD312|nr:hypothetical protein [Pedobacter nototheniae]
MKFQYRILLLIFLSLKVLYGYSQTAEQLTVSDTRSSNELPGNYNQIARFDFKFKSVVGILGDGYSTMLTIAPWYDASGGENHQLNFSNSGILYRTGWHGNENWNAWKKLVLANINGSIQADGGGAGLQLRPAAADHAYIEFYARSINPTARSGWFGYGGPGTNNLWVENELEGGNISILTNKGYIGIDTQTPKEKLSVNGNIRAKEVKVEATGWPDYVFAKNYVLPTLTETEKYINEKGHLPGMPSAKEVESNGLAMSEMFKLQQQKIEELTIYLIESKKEAIQFKSALKELDDQNKALERKVLNMQHKKSKK